jgi:predicted RNase H-like HicB family nuclease
MLQRTYRVEFETDPTTKQVTAKLPTLNHTADFGDTAEEALSNLRELATGLIEVLLDQGKEIPLAGIGRNQWPEWTGIRNWQRPG